MNRNCETELKARTLKRLLKSWHFWKPFLGVVLGGVVGFIYYKFVVCSSGSCQITSNPYLSILFGSALGLFITKSPCSTC